MEVTKGRTAKQISSSFLTMSKYNVKIITGYGGESFSVPMEEAHKAYYLFNNPQARGTFNNGIAIRGQDIMRIEPDYNAYFGWNPAYKPTAEDSAQITPAREKFHKLLSAASELSKNIQQLNTPLSMLIENQKQLKTPEGVKEQD
jgi:hypothetical protein